MTDSSDSENWPSDHNQPQSITVSVCCEQDDESTEYDADWMVDAIPLDKKFDVLLLAVHQNPFSQWLKQPEYHNGKHDFIKGFTREQLEKIIHELQSYVDKMPTCTPSEAAPSPLPNPKRARLENGEPGEKLCEEERE